jgi:hypothetical protein
VLWACRELGNNNLNHGQIYLTEINLRSTVEVTEWIEGIYCYSRNLGPNNF